MKQSIMVNYLPKIEKTILKLIPEIQYSAKLRGVKRILDWEQHLDEDALTKVIDQQGDQPAAGGTGNLFNFGITKTHKLLYLIEEIYQGRLVNGSGAFYYPRTGYMPWHTNSNSVGTRLYIAWADQDKQSFFRYKKGGEIITDWDSKGLNIREFEIPELPEQYWHCVGSNCNRYSFGFHICHA